MAALVSKDVAQEEVNSWLDYKKIGDSKRASQKDAIESLVEAVAEGTLIIRDDKVIVHELKFPTEGEKPIKTLEYKPRIKLNSVHAHLSGVKSTDADGRICAYVAALTTQPKAVITALDTEDYSISQSIAIFFL